MSYAEDAEVQQKVTEVLAGERGTEIWSLMLTQQLDDVIVQCRKSAEPANLAKYTFSLARTFSRFYHDHRILTEKDVVRRAVLIAVTKVVRARLTAPGVSWASTFPTRCDPLLFLLLTMR